MLFESPNAKLYPAFNIPPPVRLRWAVCARCSVITARCVQVPVFLVFAEAIKNAYKVLLCTAGAPQLRQCVCPVTLQRPTNETSIRRRRSIFFSPNQPLLCSSDLNVKTPNPVMYGARSWLMASHLHLDPRQSYRKLLSTKNSIKFHSIAVWSRQSIRSCQGWVQVETGIDSDCLVLQKHEKRETKLLLQFFCSTLWLFGLHLVPTWIEVDPFCQ